MIKIFKKIGKYFLITFIGLFLTANAFIILSGRFYLYKGVANTYMMGRKGPSIYDKDIFANSELKSTNPKPLNEHEKFNSQHIPKDFEAYLERYDTRAFLVMSKDSLLYEQYWDKHSEETLSNSFSVAKTVVALLVGIAIEEGKIKNLDEPVANYLSEFEGEELESITIRHLLTMSSGLDWSESGADPLSDNAESYYGWNLRNQVTNQKLINKPGETFRYQSGNSQLLAFIVEKATGEDLTHYAQKKIWSKIGASSDAFWSLDKENGDEKAFCCMYATARDFLKIGQLLLNEGKVGDEQVVPTWYYEEMIRPADIKMENGVKNQSYGLHLWTYFGMTNPVQYCRGILGQYIITIPEEDLLIIRLGTKRSPKFEIPEHLANDADYVKENEKQIGHPLGLFQYIALAKMIKSETEFLK
jgi:CubicO group peptidase (beta-lactamase class C family)